ncbi:transglutaminaseTgpA domain-containing protein [Actinomyces oris]|uniref:DUF3488 and transglutaminase-like domain-containing protein n=1 Tax=Actinomyces oris TaxID=544580 RepID=UPI0028D49593|nr:transglutaminase domain-containing protein [Actinomyces oris]
MIALGSRTPPDSPQALPTGAGAGAATTASSGSGSPVRRLDWASLGAVMLLLVAAGATHGAVFGSFSGYVAVAGGIVVGTLVALAGARWRWNPLEVLLAAIISYLLAGGPLALPSTTGRWGVPTMTTLQGLVVGAVTSWKDLLTIAPPAASFVGPGIVPYLSGLLCSLVAVTIALRAGRRRGWALVPVAALGLIGILWGSQRAPLALPAAGLALVVAMVWMAHLQQRGRIAAGRGIVGMPGSRRRARTRLVAGVSGMLALAVAVAALLSPVIEPGGHRDVLRDHVRPPLDLSAYASPLTSFRYWVDNQKDSTLFTVEGLKEGQRIRLATLDAYDGTVMRVGTDASAEGFRRVGSTVTDEPLPGGASTTSLSVTIKDYSGYWMPGGGRMQSVAFSGDRATGLQESLYYSEPLESAITTQGLTRGDRYTTTIMDTPTWTDAQLSDKALTTLTMPETSNVPESAGTRLSEFIGDASTPAEKIRTMAQTFSSQGFFSDGSDKLSLPSHSTARLTAFLDPKKPMIGDDEQYAVAMALMARQAGYPARVVLGFYPETYSRGTQAITGTNAHAWVEVSFSSVGWVSFDPTPPRDQKPQTEVPRPKPNPRPQVLQPPVPPQDPADLTPQTNEDRDDDSDRPSPWLAWLLLAAKVGGVLAVIAAPFVIIVAAKAWRRRRRRRAASRTERITGSWNELIDYATDLRTGVPRATTRSEQALYLDSFVSGEPNPGPTFRPRPASGSVGGLAQLVDSTVFSGQDMADTVEASAWNSTDALSRALASRTSRYRRLVARFSVTSLRRPPSRSPVRWPHRLSPSGLRRPPHGSPTEPLPSPQGDD